MTFHTLLGPSDPRVLSGILAKRTLDHLNHPVDYVPERVAMCILNFIRLVDMYCYSDMRTEPAITSVFEHEPLDHKRASVYATDPLEEVQHALDKARKEAFGNMSRKRAATRIHKSLVWHLEMPDERKTRTKGSDSETRKFLKVFIKELPA